jgi:DNA-binding LacI/PurR family transcriptional regulator
MSQVTIRDIAQATGLSSGTISRALKNQAGMTDATRLKVQDAAQRMGYDFSQLRKVRIRRIAFLLHSQHNTLASSPFFSPVLHGAEEACRREGIALSFNVVGPAAPVMEQIRLHQPDALLCAGFFEPEVLAALKQTGKPMVLIDMQQRGFTSVNPDNAMGGYLATRHLLRSGRRRIAMLSGSLAHFSIEQRNRGFRRALFESRTLADPDLEVIVPQLGDGDSGVVEAMQRLLSLPRPPDAVLCYNDSTRGDGPLPRPGHQGAAGHRHRRLRRHQRRRHQRAAAQHAAGGQGGARRRRRRPAAAAQARGPHRGTRPAGRPGRA